MIAGVISGDGGRRALWIVAAAVAVGLIAFLWAGPRRESRLPEPGTNAANVELVAPRGSVDKAPARFEWKAVPGATAYEVRIADADSVWPLFVRTSESPLLLLGAEEATALTPGRVHEWTVEARGAGGEALASGSAQFRVAVPGAGS